MHCVQTFVWPTGATSVGLRDRETNVNRLVITLFTMP